MDTGGGTPNDAREPEPDITPAHPRLPDDRVGPDRRPPDASERALGDFTTTPAILRLVPLALADRGARRPASPWRCST